MKTMPPSSRMQVEKLKREMETPAPKLELNPPGTSSSNGAVQRNHARQTEIQRQVDRLQQTKKDVNLSHRFEKSAGGREME